MGRQEISNANVLTTPFFKRGLANQEKLKFKCFQPLSESFPNAFKNVHSGNLKTMNKQGKQI